VASWPAPVPKNAATLLRKAAEDYQQTAAGFLEGLQQGTDDLRGEVEQLKTDAAMLQQQVAQAGTVVEGQKGRLDTAIADFQQQFSNAQEQRSQRFEEEVRKLTEARSETLKQLEDSANDDHERLRDQGEEQVERLRQLHQQASTLVEAIGARGISGGYGQHATEEKRNADRWRWITVAALVAVAGGGLIALLTTQNMPFQWERFLAKAALTAPLIALAAYASRQSGHHRNAERQARRRDLDLAALHPYLATLPEDIQQEIKREIASRLFVRDELPSTIPGEDGNQA
jgi:ElaB/YqjD/DUF883 family membrane-anchored ribosome-binding protein